MNRLVGRVCPLGEGRRQGTGRGREDTKGSVTAWWGPGPVYPWPRLVHPCHLTQHSLWMQSELTLVDVLLPQVSELTLFSLITWPNTDTQFKHEYSIPEQAGSVASLLYCPSHFHCLRGGIPGRTGLPLSHQPSAPTHGLSLSLSAEGGSVRAGVRRTEASWEGAGRVGKQQTLLHLAPMNALRGCTGRQASLRYASVNSCIFTSRGVRRRARVTCG